MHGEDIHQVLFVVLSPDVIVVRGVDQLHTDSDPVCNSLHATLYHRHHAQLFADLADTLPTAGITHHRSPRDDLQTANLRQVSENFVLNAAREKSVFLVRAEILKWKDSNRPVEVASANALP